MIISFNTIECEKNNLTLAEGVLLSLYLENNNVKEIEQSLISKGLITHIYNDPTKSHLLKLTNKGADIFNTIVIDSDKNKEPENRLDALAKELKQIYPKGKKDGTNYYWADGVALIKRRLKLFFKKYENSYTDTQIIEATKKYVESFNGNYNYMKLLKYFIFKEKLGAGGDVEGESELINYIENADQENLNNEWTITLM